jgi:hypothetical protein
MESAIDALLCHGGAHTSPASPRPPAPPAGPAAFDGVYVISGEEADKRADSALHNPLTRLLGELLGRVADDAEGGSAAAAAQGTHMFSLQGGGGGAEEGDDGHEDSLEGFCRVLRTRLTAPAYFEVGISASIYCLHKTQNFLHNG